MFAGQRRVVPVGDQQAVRLLEVFQRQAGSVAVIGFDQREPGLLSRPGLRQQIQRGGGTPWQKP